MIILSEVTLGNVNSAQTVLYFFFFNVMQSILM
jgi:hypothetical protein